MHPMIHQAKLKQASEYRNPAGLFLGALVSAAVWSLLILGAVRILV